MITIATDSSVYIKKAEAETLGVRIIPLTYTADGLPYVESYGDENGDFETLLKKSANFTTSQPSSAAFLSCFEEELAKGRQVLCLTISSRLSGAYGTAYLAAQHTGSGNIAVFDSYLTAGGLYLLVKEAARLIADGARLQDLSRSLPSIRDKISIAFSVDDIAPLRASGRVGFVRMGVGTILDIKPILICKDGAVVYENSARGSADLSKKLACKVSDNVSDAVINYIGDNRAVMNLYTMVKAAHPDIMIKLQKVGPVLGIHIGLKAMGISVLSR